MDGKKLIHYYNIQNYPFIAILDPRTGEKVLQFNNTAKMDQCMFCEKVTNFLCENELNVEHFVDEAAKEEKEIVQIDDDSSGSSKDVVCLNGKADSKQTNFGNVNHLSIINTSLKGYSES